MIPTDIIYTVVLLTYNRRHKVEQQMQHLAKLTNPNTEIIVVDNCSQESVADLVATDPRASLVRNPENLGAVGRNKGMLQAKGQFIITLDDDVYGITDDHLTTIKEKFDADDYIAAINFSVREEDTNRITDWCHPRDMNIYATEEFESNDISEGAVALRKTALDEVGYYPDDFFISHEGPDLAFRLINAAYKVIYTPQIIVFHGYEQQARVSWRRYYYDTRNHLWLIVRNYTLLYGFQHLIVAWSSLLIYALRDGYLRYWLKGVYHGLKGCPKAYRDRVKPTSEAVLRWKEIERHRPSFWTRLKKRIFSDVVRG